MAKVKPITRKIRTSSLSPSAAFRSHTTRCPECGSEFEILSSQWAYRLRQKGGKTAYYCRYKCWRRAANRKPKPLKGETLVNYCGDNGYENLG